MEEMCAYQFTVRGRVDASDLNAVSAFQLDLLDADETATRFLVRTDQSGLIGLLRHLNARGITLLSVAAVLTAQNSSEQSVR